MSFVALAWAAKQKTGGLATKAALMALANYADDTGRAYPSTAAVADFAEMDHKTATAALDRLAAAGLIVDTGDREGRTKQVRVYQLHLNTPANPEAFQIRKPSVSSAEAPQKRGTDTIREPVSTKASPSPRTRTAQPARNAVQALPDLPDGASSEQWDAFVAMRRQMKKPLGPHAAGLILAKLIELAGDGHDPGKVLDQSTMRGWQGLFPIKGDDDGQRRGTAGRSAWAERHPGGRTGLAADRVFGGLDGDRPM